AAAMDVARLPPFDASLPALPVCEAGSYFVTVDDGTGIRTLNGGWRTATECELDASPSVGLEGCGNLCDMGYVVACGDGVAVSLSLAVNGPPNASATSFTSGFPGTYVD